MKILVVLPYFYPKMGGLENYAYNVFKRLKNHDITVLCSGKENSREMIEGMDVIRLKHSAVISNTPVNLKLPLTISRILKRESFDIVNAHTPVPYSADMAAIASRKHGVPFLLTYHNDLLKEKGFLQLISSLYNNSLLKLTLDVSKKIITSSYYVYHESPFLKAHAGKIELIPPGVDLDTYSPGSGEYVRRKYGIPHGSEVVLFVGAMNKGHRHKGVEILMEAFYKIKGENVYLVLAGTGDMVPHYKKIASSLGIQDKTIFTGLVDEFELIELYRMASMLVLPTLTVVEGFGMVLIEANACGKPVIGSKIGGIKYVIKDGETGLLVPPGDPDALADAIMKLLDDEDLAHRMGSNGRRMVMEKYTWDKSAKMTERIFENLLNK